MFKKVTANEWFEVNHYDPSREDEDFVEEICKEYEDIKLPRRATKGSAGYDFFMPFDFVLDPHESAVIPTGIIWECKQVYVDDLILPVLKLYPKSGLGFKYHLGLANTVGIVDMDFKKQIMIKLVNNGDETIYLPKGKGFAQGIFEYVNVFPNYDKQFETEERNGGFGSTKNSKGE